MIKNEAQLLNARIIFLQDKQANDLKLLKENFHIVHEELKPINFIKNTFHEVTTSPDIKNNLVDHAIGLASGYLSKRVLMGTSNHPVKKVIGTLLQFAVANIVSKHSDKIKSTGKNLMGLILNSRNKINA